MTEHELAEYCRSKGLFVEKVKKWRTISIQAHQSEVENKYKQDRIRHLTFFKLALRHKYYR
jgi:hypothetical protein